MRKKNITTGEIYAYKRHSSDPIIPALVLDNTHLWTGRPLTGDKAGTTEYTINHDAKKPETRTFDLGFLVVTTTRSFLSRKEAAAAAQLLAALDVPDEITETTVDAFAATLPDGLKVSTCNYLRFTDTWTAALAQAKAGEKAQADIAARRRLRIEDNTRRWDAIRERLAAHGITPDIGDAAQQPGNVRVPLTLGDLAVLLDAAER